MIDPYSAVTFLFSWPGSWGSFRYGLSILRTETRSQGRRDQQSALSGVQTTRRSEGATRGANVTTVRGKFTSQRRKWEPALEDRLSGQKRDPSVRRRTVSVKDALVLTYADVVQNHTMQMAAALAYYFVLSFFPALIFLSAVVAYLPVPDLFSQALALMASFLPADRAWASFTGS